MSDDRERSLWDLPTSWDTVVQGTPHFLRIDPKEVVIGSGAGHTEIAAGVPFAEFVGGAYHDLVREVFGDAVLAEAIESARLAPDTLEHRAQARDRLRLRHALERYPLDPTLAGFVDNPDPTDDGFRHYAASGPHTDPVGTTVSRSTRLRDGPDELIYGITANLAGRKQRFEWPIGWMYRDGRYRFMVEVGLQPSSGLAWRGRFYLVSADTLVVLDNEGHRLEREEDREMFGERVRITRVIRVQERVCFGYSWYFDDEPDGFVEASPDGRLLGRWEAGR